VRVQCFGARRGQFIRADAQRIRQVGIKIQALTGQPAAPTPAKREGVAVGRDLVGLRLGDQPVCDGPGQRGGFGLAARRGQFIGGDAQRGGQFCIGVAQVAATAAFKPAGWKNGGLVRANVGGGAGLRAHLSNRAEGGKTAHRQRGDHKNRYPSFHNHRDSFVKSGSIRVIGSNWILHKE
jgi:hypothetical protein